MAPRVRFRARVRPIVRGAAAIPKVSRPSGRSTACVRRWNRQVRLGSASTNVDPLGIRPDLPPHQHPRRDGPGRERRRRSAGGCSAAGRSPACRRTSSEPPYDTNGRGTPVTGMMPEAHADVLERLEAEPAGDARPRRPGRTRRRRARRSPARARCTHAEQRDQHAGTDQAELLAGDGEDEVGVLLGHEAGPGLRAVEEPLAEQAAVADRDPGLLVL